MQSCVKILIPQIDILLISTQSTPVIFSLTLDVFRNKLFVQVFDQTLLQFLIGRCEY